MIRIARVPILCPIGIGTHRSGGEKLSRVIYRYREDINIPKEKNGNVVNVEDTEVINYAVEYLHNDFYYY